MQLQWSPHGLYNQDSHRQRIINWIDGTGQLSASFDFTTKGILQEAVKGELWRLRDPQGKPRGVIGWWPSRAVTFLDNHDTGSIQMFYKQAKKAVESTYTVVPGQIPQTSLRTPSSRAKRRQSIWLRRPPKRHQPLILRRKGSKRSNGREGDLEVRETVFKSSL